jgi:hypothetical protein
MNCVPLDGVFGPSSHFVQVASGTHLHGQILLDQWEFVLRRIVMPIFILVYCVK